MAAIDRFASKTRKELKARPVLPLGAVVRIGSIGVRTGQIAVNGCIPGDAPFGGFKQSGLGREGGGLPGLHRYMEPKAIGIPI